MFPLGAEEFREVRLKIMRWGNNLVDPAGLSITTKVLIRGRHRDHEKHSDDRH